MQTRHLCGDIVGSEEDLCEELAVTKMDLHVELDLRIKGTQVAMATKM
jgi:hypothetical protein